MLLIKLLILCEQSKDRSTISFRTKNFQGDLCVEAGIVTRVAGLESVRLKEALFEETLEFYIKKTPEGIAEETQLSISGLTAETAAYLHRTLETKTTFASFDKPPSAGLFEEKALQEHNSFLALGSQAAKESESKNLALRKTINVDLKSINTKLSIDGQQKPAPIILHFTLGVPEKKVMGRSQDCEIMIDAEDASRRHCELNFSGNNLTIKDLGSSNGTFLNSRVVIESNAKSNDVLRVGTTDYMIVIE